jgi:plasmid stability protein
MEVSMGDLLIRNIADALKTDLDALADRTGRSLSETAKEVLRDGVEIAKKRLAASESHLRRRIRFGGRGRRVPALSRSVA